MSCEIYTPLEGPDGMLLERNGKLTMWKSKSKGGSSFHAAEQLQLILRNDHLNKTGQSRHLWRYLKSSQCEQHRAYLMSCEIYTPLEGPDGMLLERNGKLTMWKSKSKGGSSFHAAEQLQLILRNDHLNKTGHNSKTN